MRTTDPPVPARRRRLRTIDGQPASGPRPRARAAFAAGPALLVALLAAPAWAHQVGLSRGLYRLDGATIAAEITFARGELRDLVSGLDGDGDGTLSDAELARAGASLQTSVVEQIELRADDRACPGIIDRAALVEEDGATIVATYRCPAAPANLELRLPLLARLSTGHRHLAQVTRAGADPEDSLADWILHARAPRAALASTGEGESPPPPVQEYFALGVEHILIGVDHLVFLLGLVLVGGRWRSLLAVITAFTLGHSLSLALATLDIWTPSGDWVEPAIAASIAYVGLENFFVRDAGGRWRITLPFGFVHGFGFAGALGEIGVPPDGAGLALLLFNLGVEAGQLAALAVVLPMLAALRRASWFRDHGTRVVSALIVIAGLAWLAERTLLA